MAITQPTAANVGDFSTEIEDSEAAKGNYVPRISAALRTLASETQSAFTTAQATLHVGDLASGILAAGTPLAAWADNSSSNPGITLADSKAKAVRWNNNASQTAVWYSVTADQDVNDAVALVAHYLVSKSSNTVGDATKVTLAGFFQTVGAAHDADADVGGDSDAVVGNAAAKTVSELTYSISAADLPPAPWTLSFSVKPKDGTLGTDDFLCEGIWFEYTRVALDT